MLRILGTSLAASGLFIGLVSLGIPGYVVGMVAAALWVIIR